MPNNKHHAAPPKKAEELPVAEEKLIRAENASIDPPEKQERQKHLTPIQWARCTKLRKELQRQLTALRGLPLQRLILKSYPRACKRLIY
jgi:hypothetical protein